ncbi:MAG: Maf family nucleotide pyrophosphatase [Sporichthyaceae bacterium]|nr:Maf family nucleotide pyrophosphatase [Sporichthyaceae bacterium]
MPGRISPAAQLILASASTGRRNLLRAAGIEPVVAVSNVAETEIPGETAHEHCLRLAILKAEAVAAGRKAGLVLGADSVLDLDGEPLGKPASAAEAVQRWRAMSGRTGTLRTGHCLIDARTGKCATGVASTLVRFGTPTDAEITAYVASGEPLRVAGAFTIDGLGGPLIDGVDGDPSNVVGLSLPLLRTLLAELGYTLFDLWTSRPDGGPS